MKPTSPFCRDNLRFPLTDYFFQSRFGDWRNSSPYDGDDDSRRFRNFSREFLLESARERRKEMIVFAIVILTALWPVIYMIVSVVELFLKGRPLTE
jgi:nitrate reductase NapE component